MRNDRMLFRNNVIFRAFSSDANRPPLTQPSTELWLHIQRETERTRQVIDAALRLEIESEILKQSQVASFPELGPCGQFYYLSTVGSDNCLRYSKSSNPDGSDAVEILNLNLNQYEMKAMSLSVDDTLLAYVITSVQTSRSELWVKRLQSNSSTARLVPTSQTDILSSVEWGPLQPNGLHSLFFTCTDDWHRPCQVKACQVNDDLSTSVPVQVFHSADPAVIVDVQRCKGCHFVAISAATKMCNEIYLMRDIVQPPLLVRARQSGIQYHIDVGSSGEIYLLASADKLNHECGLCEELTLFRTSIANLPLKSNFGVFLAGSTDGFVISDMDIFRDAVVLYERSSLNGSQRIRVKGIDGDSVAEIPMDLNPCGNMFFDAKVVQFTIESPIRKPILYQYNFQDKSLSEVHHAMCHDETVQDKYSRLQMLVPSHDGVQVPLTLFHRQDVDLNRKDNKVVLVGYGAYGEPVIRGFDPTCLPLVDRGIVVAYAHTRGGGDLGKSWYNAGRLYNKRNTIHDYIACAETLVDKIVEPKRLTAKAVSAGGVTVGASINHAPELFGSAVFVNAFLDVTTSMYNKMALTDHEFDEWGDPTKDQQAAEVISSICPVANLSEKQLQKFPRTLVVGTLDDANVPFWHALTYYAKLRGGRHLLYMLPKGGHHLHGTSLEVGALTNGFIIKSLTNGPR